VFRWACSSSGGRPVAAERQGRLSATSVFFVVHVSRSCGIPMHRFHRVLDASLRCNGRFCGMLTCFWKKEHSKKSIPPERLYFQGQHGAIMRISTSPPRYYRQKGAARLNIAIHRLRCRASTGNCRPQASVQTLTADTISVPSTYLSVSCYVLVRHDTQSARVPVRRSGGSFLARDTTHSGVPRYACSSFPGRRYHGL
jgi:hypothetical protein